MDRSRLGQFFLLLGLIGLVVFITGDPVKSPGVFGYLLGGLALSLLGVFMMVKNRKPPPPTARFATYRKMRQKSAERKARKKAKQTEKEKKRKR